ncbi:Protein NIF3 [Sphaceloma murrayae]|uniref:Protein NIF3 n=1 Tax=Sphaceloma murrayae TaxID=2082308 RepID=A0A2K1QGS7_9PEZI|nr:Protein NIF3 [Sphaceloma murrayae]
MASPTSSSPFSRAVVNAMRKLYPESLADKSFDNTGLLLEAPFDPIRRQMNSALLTIDLTKAVADEAIERNDSIIVAYRIKDPIIFRGLKSLTLGDTQQKTLLRLAAEGISVYSPHTAVDCAPGGLGDWLADIVTGTPTTVSSIPSEVSTEDSKSTTSKEKAPTTPPQSSVDDDPFTDSVPKRPTYMLQHHPSQLAVNDRDRERALQLSAAKHTRKPIVPSSVPGYDKDSAGMGRIVRFATPQSLVSIIDRIGLGLGNPKGFPIAVPQGKSIDEIRISSVAICAGSGGGVFSSLGKSGQDDVDLLFTGELSHHEALAAIEQGKCVITLFHSNTERGFLSSVLKGQLEKTVGEEWTKLRAEELETGTNADDFAEVLADEGIEIHVSEVDRDPYGIVINKEEI